MSNFLSKMASKLMPQSAQEQIKGDLPGISAVATKTIHELGKKINHTVTKFMKEIDEYNSAHKLQMVIEEFNHEREPLEKLKTQYEKELKRLLLKDLDLGDITYKSLLVFIKSDANIDIHQIIMNLFRLDLILKGRLDTYLSELEEIQESKLSTGMSPEQEQKRRDRAIRQLKKNVTEDFKISDADKVNFLFDAMITTDDVFSYEIGVGRAAVEKKIKEYNAITNLERKAADEGDAKKSVFLQRKLVGLTRPTSMKTRALTDAQIRKLQQTVRRKAAIKRQSRRRHQQMNNAREVNDGAMSHGGKRRSGSYKRNSK